MTKAFHPVPSRSRTRASARPPKHANGASGMLGSAFRAARARPLAPTARLPPRGHWTGPPGMSCSSRVADGEEGSGGTGYRRVLFHRGQRLEDELALVWIAQPVLDIWRPVEQALDGQQVVQAQPGVRYLARDAGPVVEVGRGKEARVGVGV